MSLELLSFKGSIGRTELWAMVFAVSLLSLLLQLIPTSEYFVVLYGGLGMNILSYATPEQPSSPVSWAWLILYYFGVIGSYWLLTAAQAKRLHDLGYSARWIVYVIEALALSTSVEAMFGPPGKDLSLFDVLDLALTIPASVLGAIGMFMMLFLPGEKLPLAENDLRREIK